MPVRVAIILPDAGMENAVSVGVLEPHAELDGLIGKVVNSHIKNKRQAARAVGGGYVADFGRRGSLRPYRVKDGDGEKKEMTKAIVFEAAMIAGI